MDSELKQLNVLAALLVAYIIFIMITSIIKFIINGITWYKLYQSCNNEFKDKSYRAWIPFCATYQRCNYMVTVLGDPCYLKWLLTFSWAFTFIPYMGSIISMVLSIVYVIELYRTSNIYNCSRLKSALISIFLSWFVPLFWLTAVKTISCTTYSQQDDYYSHNYISFDDI